MGLVNIIRQFLGLEHSRLDRTEIDHGTSQNIVPYAIIPRLTAATDTELDQEASDSPPPYSRRIENDRSSNDQRAFLDRITAIRRTAPDHGALANLCSRVESDRWRNFLRFTLAVDYRCDVGASLDAHDRAHFATMKVFLDDLASDAECRTLSAEESAALAPYFWHALQEPCIALDIPVELAMNALHRFFTHQDAAGTCKGCLDSLAIRERSGMAALARKLACDHSIMIPRVIREVRVRVRMFRSLTAESERFFKTVPDLSAEARIMRVPTDCLVNNTRRRADAVTGFWLVDEPAYELNKRGRKWSANHKALHHIRDASTESSPAASSRAAFEELMIDRMERAKVVIDAVRERRRRSNPPPPPSGRFYSELKLRHDRKRLYRRSYHLPDFFAIGWYPGGVHHTHG